MARLSWFRFLGRDSHPLLDRMLESLATGGAGDQHLGARFARLFGTAAPVASAPADSAIRDGSLQAPATMVTPSRFVPVTDPLIALDQVALVPLGDAVAAPDTDPDSLPTSGDERGAIAMMGGGLDSPLGGVGSNMLRGYESGSRYYVIYGENLDGGLVVDRTNNSLLAGGPGDFPELGLGRDDMLVLSGDYSAGIALPSQPQGIDTVLVSGGNNFNLVSTDDQVAAGQTLTIDAMRLGAGNHILFDGGAETDGRFVFHGSESADGFIGGAGNDRIVGRGGADMLAGGAGRDTFAYFGARESTGPNYDTLGDFDAASDKIDLPGTVSGFAAPVQSGTLSLATFDTDLSQALSGLGASQAAWFAPDAGDLAGQIFLVIDANGVAGYQEGEDYVFAVSGSPLADLSGRTDIFV